MMNDLLIQIAFDNWLLQNGYFDSEFSDEEIKITSLTDKELKNCLSN